ncbi:hypothetical protein [Streptomyces sp. NPDC006739]
MPDTTHPDPVETDAEVEVHGSLDMLPAAEVIDVGAGWVCSVYDPRPI